MTGPVSYGPEKTRLPHCWTVWTYAGRTFERRARRVYMLTAATLGNRKRRISSQLQVRARRKVVP